MKTEEFSFDKKVFIAFDCIFPVWNKIGIMCHDDLICSDHEYFQSKHPALSKNPIDGK